MRAEGDAPLPSDAAEAEAGDWVLAAFAVGDSATSLAARVRDSGAGRRLWLEPRDWELLLRFGRGEAPASLPPVTEAPVRPPTGTRVLVLDEDRELERVLCDLLEAAGFLPISARSVEAARALLRSEAVAALVLGADLPAMCGFAFCRQLRAEGVSAPVLMLAPSGTCGDLAQAIGAGANDCLAKPFRAPELRARLMGLLQRASVAPPRAAW